MKPGLLFGIKWDWIGEQIYQKYILDLKYMGPNIHMTNPLEKKFGYVQVNHKYTNTNIRKLCEVKIESTS